MVAQESGEIEWISATGSVQGKGVVFELKAEWQSTATDMRTLYDRRPP
jgi:hypothetical protein